MSLNIAICNTKSFQTERNSWRIVWRFKTVRFVYMHFYLEIAHITWFWKCPISQSVIELHRSMVALRNMVYFIWNRLWKAIWAEDAQNVQIRVCLSLSDRVGVSALKPFCLIFWYLKSQNKSIENPTDIMNIRYPVTRFKLCNGGNSQSLLRLSLSSLYSKQSTSYPLESPLNLWDRE